MDCLACNSENQDNSKFCSNCGKVVVISAKNQQDPVQITETRRSDEELNLNEKNTNRVSKNSGKSSENVSDKTSSLINQENNSISDLEMKTVNQENDLVPIPNNSLEEADKIKKAISKLRIARILNWIIIILTLISSYVVSLASFVSYGPAHPIVTTLDRLKYLSLVFQVSQMVLLLLLIPATIYLRKANNKARILTIAINFSLILFAIYGWYSRSTMG